MKLQCTSPKYAIYDGVNESGKRHIKFISKETYEKIEDGFEKHFKKEDLLLIPCGKCIGCRMKYSYQWANRLMLELQLHDHSKCWFVTLTYDPEHIGLCRPASDPKTGEVIPELWTLEKKHLQDFMKRLRDAVYPDHIRFFASGEYGSLNHRCHFHLIIYNLPLPEGDLTFLKKSKLGYDYFSSDLISRKWTYGFNVVTPVSWQNCSYTARYMLKKMKGLESYVYHDYGIEAPFSLCSRKPGIAKGYYDSMEDFGEVSYISIGTDSGVRKFAPPQYFENLFEKEFPAEAEIRKARRKKFAESAQAIELSNTDKDRESYLKDCEEILEKKDKVLYNYRDL